MNDQPLQPGSAPQGWTQGPQLSAPQPVYGQDPMAYSQPQQVYGQDPMAYSQPQQMPGGEEAYPQNAARAAAQQQEEKQPDRKVPKVKPPRKKLNRVQIGVILAVLVFAGVYLFNTLQPARSTSALIEAGTLGAHYTGTGLIVRSEVPYEAESVTSIEYITSEGRLAGRGATICNVFSTGYSAKELTTLQDYRDQIRDYQLKLVQEETAYDAKMERVTADVLTRAKEVRQIIGGSRGNLINEESLLSEAISTRQDYIDTKYATDQRLSRLLDDEQAQQQRIDSWTKSYAAANSCIISFYTDGYEHALNL